MTGKRGRIRNARRPARLRRGSVVLELIVMLPIWLIVMGAIVLFGLLIGNRQQVALAARVGAKEAARTDLSASSSDVPGNVVGVVEQQLLSSGIKFKYCRITLEHNLGTGTPPVTLSSGTGCDEVDPPPPPDTWPSGNYVRVTVYVPATELAPNVLRFFGLDISNVIIRQATTFRHEL